MKQSPKKPVTDRPWWRAPFRYLLRMRPRPRHLHGSFIHRLLGSRLFEPALWVPGRETLAKGVAIGTFIGLLPLIGLQILVSAFLCYLMRANIAAAALATLITNPFTAPGILWAQYKFGVWLLPFLRWAHGSEYENAGRHLAAYGKPLLVGCLTSAAVAALIAYPLMHGLWIAGEKMVRRRREARLLALRRRHQAEHPPAE